MFSRLIPLVGEISPWAGKVLRRRTDAVGRLPKQRSPSRTDRTAHARAPGRRLSLRLHGLQLALRLRLPVEHEPWLAGLRRPVADRRLVLRRVLRRDVASARAASLALARADISAAAAAAVTTTLATTTLPTAADAPPAAKPAAAAADAAVPSAAAAPAAAAAAALAATVATQAPVARQGREQGDVRGVAARGHVPRRRDRDRGRLLALGRRGPDLRTGVRRRRDGRYPGDDRREA